MFAFPIPVKHRVWITFPFRCVRWICLFILMIIAGDNTPRFQQSVKENQRYGDI